MAQVLSHPLRLGPDGGFLKIEQDSDDSLAEQLAVLLLTKQGERSLVPTFGVPDPTFRLLSEDEINLSVALFGPPISVSVVEYAIDAEGRAEVTVVYDES